MCNCGKNFLSYDRKTRRKKKQFFTAKMYATFFFCFFKVLKDEMYCEQARHGAKFCSEKIMPYCMPQKYFLPRFQMARIAINTNLHIC